MNGVSRRRPSFPFFHNMIFGSPFWATFLSFLFLKIIKARKWPKGLEILLVHVRVGNFLPGTRTSTRRILPYTRYSTRR